MLMFGSLGFKQEMEMNVEEAIGLMPFSSSLHSQDIVVEIELNKLTDRNVINFGVEIYIHNVRINRSLK